MFFVQESPRSLNMEVGLLPEMDNPGFVIAKIVGCAVVLLHDVVFSDSCRIRCANRAFVRAWLWIAGELCAVERPLWISSPAYLYHLHISMRGGR